LQRIWCFILHVTTSETFSSLQRLLRGELISETHGMSVRAALKIKSKGQISSHLITFWVQHNTYSYRVNINFSSIVF